MPMSLAGYSLPRAQLPHRPLPGHSLLATLDADLDPSVKHHDAVIPQWIKTRDVTTLDAATDGLAGAAAAQLQFGLRPRPQPRLGFDQRGTTTDVDEHHGLARPQHRTNAKPRASASQSTLTTPLGDIKCYGRHVRACASNINTRTRPVAP
jgi:hypothetical protein